MRTFTCIALAVILVSVPACSTKSSAEKILRSTKADDGTEEYELDFEVLGEIRDRVSVHAGSYPPNFSSPEQEEAVREELSLVLGALNVFYNPEVEHTGFLLNYGYFHNMGHNLDFPESGEMAQEAFLRLLELEPDSPQGNYRYGSFLSQTAIGQAESIPYLEKALRLGVADAKFKLGLVYIVLEDNENALRYLKEYAVEAPNSRAPFIVQAIEEGRVKRSAGE